MIDARKIGVLAVVALLVGSGVAAAATVSVDNETTTTTTTSTLTDGATVTDFNASADSNLSATALGPSGEDAVGLKVELNETGTVYYRNETLTNESYNSTADQTSWTATFAESELADVPMDANENVTVDLVFYNSSNESETASMTVTLDNTEERAVASVTDADAEDEDIVQFGEAQNLFGLDVSSIPVLSSQTTETEPAQAERSVEVADNTSEVRVAFKNASTQDAWEATVPEEDDGPIFAGTLSVDGRFVPLFTSGQELPEWVDETEDPYAVVADDGSSVTVKNVDAMTDGTETLELVATGNEKMNRMQAFDMLSNDDYDVGTFDLYTKALTVNDFNGDPFESY